MTDSNIHDKKYGGQEYYWGMQPSKLCTSVLEALTPDPSKKPPLLDLGCGEGRNAVHFAKHGFDVTGLDISAAGLEKARRLAEETGVAISTIHGSIIDCALTGAFDVIFSTGTLHYLPPVCRLQRFEHFKAVTSGNGLHAMSVFVEKPFIPRAPDAEATVHLYRSGELMSYYWDWKILYCEEQVFDCMSSGVPHKHAVNRLIARRP
jgi:tellurite methyltransferase